VSGPYQSEVYVPQPIGSKDEKKRRGEIAKRGRQPLYVRRDVENADEIAAWAKAQGFKTVMEGLHVTIAYSKEPVDWLKMGQPSTWGAPDDDEAGSGRLVIPAGGPRVLTSFDKPGLAVLGFASSELGWRNREMQDRGASWDHDGYTPHITISWDAGDVDLEAMKPYTGRIVLGPEIFEPINSGWRETIVEKKGSELRKAHVTDVGEHGLVFGFAVVSKVNGQPYYDRQIGEDGRPRADHIPEEAMLDAALDYMKRSRAAKQMHEGDVDGMVPFAIPLTTDIRKFIVENDTTGLLIGMLPAPDALAKFKSGDYTGFSIGGSRIVDEEVS
jgi:hypothetical protein